MRRRIVTLIACGAVSAASCTMVSGGASTITSSVSPSRDPLGTVTIRPGEPIVLGTLLTSSGPAAAPGIDAMRGVRLALDYLDLDFDGHPGTLLGHPIVIESEAETCSATGGIRGAKTLAQDRRVLAVIGPTCSASALGGAVQTLSDAGIVTISPSATNPKLTDPAQHAPLFLRTAYNGLTEGAAAADFSYGTLKAREGATAHDGEPQGDAETAGFRDRFERLGGLITGSFAIPADVSRSQALVQAIGPRTSVLYATSVGDRCAELSHVWDSTPATATSTFLGGQGCMVTSVVADRPTRTSPTYVVGPDLARMADSSFYRTQFLPAYQSQFGTPPISTTAPFAFDATDIILDAIQVAATHYADGTIVIGRSALQNAVFATKDYQGLTGTLTCTPLGECSTDPSIAVYLLPDVPLAGGDPNGKPVFTETVSLRTLESSPSPS